jgi:hypothetical protein
MTQQAFASGCVVLPIIFANSYREGTQRLSRQGALQFARIIQTLQQNWRK